MISNRRFDLNGKTYYWFGGFSAIIKSFERRVLPGDTRVIGGTLFYAYAVYPYPISSDEVSWTVLEPTAEKINALRDEFFR